MSAKIKELIQAMPSQFLPEKAGDAKALIQLDLSGEGGGNWVIDVADGQCQVREEVASQPGVTVTMTAEDFAALLRNELDAIPAFMSGKIKVSGNVGLVMQLMQWFKMGA
jgi:putative sterol carrier protein